MTRYTLDTSDTHKYGEILLVGENREDYITVGPKDGDEDAPNYEMAHLIAATPDLYEALKGASELINRILKGDDWGAIEEYYIEAMDALAKARGEA